MPNGVTKFGTPAGKNARGGTIGTSSWSSSLTNPLLIAYYFMYGFLSVPYSLRMGLAFSILSVTNLELITAIGKPAPGIVDAPT